jgi:hypothetical protein
VAPAAGTLAVRERGRSVGGDLSWPEPAYDAALPVDQVTGVRPARLGIGSFVGFALIAKERWAVRHEYDFQLVAATCE